MKISVNGSLRELNAVLSISEFVKINDLDPGKVVVEHNGHVVGNKDWEHVLLRDSDKVVVLSFVGGG